MTTKVSEVRGIPEAEFFANEAWLMPHLETVAKHDKDGMTAQEYREAILDRHFQVWELGDRDGVCLTRVTREAIRLEWVAGKNRKRWQADLDAVLRKWAYAMGKKRLIVLARPGWSKLAEELGYKEFQRGYEVAL